MKQIGQRRSCSFQYFWHSSVCTVNNRKVIQEDQQQKNVKNGPRQKKYGEAKQVPNQRMTEILDNGQQPKQQIVLIINLCSPKPAPWKRGRRNWHTKSQHVTDYSQPHIHITFAQQGSCSNSFNIAIFFPLVLENRTKLSVAVIRKQKGFLTLGLYKLFPLF